MVAWIIEICAIRDVGWAPLCVVTWELGRRLWVGGGVGFEWAKAQKEGVLGLIAQAPLYAASLLPNACRVDDPIFCPFLSASSRLGA